MRKIFLITLFVVVLSACEIQAAPPATPTAVPESFFATPVKFPLQEELPSRGGQVNVTCTNTLDDANVLNTAISNSPTGSEIIIQGTCLIDKTIKLLGDRSYRGLSRTGTVLKQADRADLVALLASDTFLENQSWTGTPVSLRHLTLDGNKANNQKANTAGIALRSWMSVVEDVYITNMSGDGLRLTNRSADDTELTTSQVNGRISGNMIENSGRHGIYVEDSQNAVTDWTLIDNWIGASGADGIHMENAAGWMIERNHIYGVPENALYANRLWGTTISDNLIEGFGDTNQAGAWYGIYATVQGGAVSTISNNRIFNLGPHKDGKLNSSSTYRYLALTVNYETGMASVTGNVLRGSNTADETGLYYYADGNRKLVVISTGNLVEFVKTPLFLNSGVTVGTGY